MSRFLSFTRYGVYVLIWSLGLAFVFSVSAYAVLPSVDSKMLSDSEEPIPRRIYSYDIGIDSRGDVHIVFTRPVIGHDDAQVVYAHRKSGTWLSERVLSSNGWILTTSTRLVVGTDDVVHVCYINQDLTLHYLTISDDTPGDDVSVSPGGWHTRMELDDSNRAMFLREGEDWRENPTVSKLVLVTSSDGSSWSEEYLDLPTVTKFRVGNFLYKDGVYHITYGDNTVIKDVLNGKGATNYVDGVFHNLHYASSLDGQNWSTSIVDGSSSLYEKEFWTSLELDGSTPIVSMYKYKEYGDKYNTGTSALLAKFDSGSWLGKNITPADYPATREGMGVDIVVDGAGSYYGVWDFSPDNTYDDNFRGERGNIALARSGADGAWGDKWQIASFSAEGEVKLRLKGEKIYVLVLGDFVDTKLNFWEFDLNALPGTSLPPVKQPKPGNSKAVLPSMYMLL